MIRELLGLDFHKEQISEFLKNRNISTTMEMLDTELSIIKEKMEVLQKKKGADCQPDSVFASRAE